VAGSNEILSETGDQIRQARLATGHTQEVAARHAGMARARYVELERGQLDVRLTTLVNAARAVGLDLMLVPIAYVPAVRSMLRPSNEDADETPMFQPDEEAEDELDVSPRRP
jgi:transcriptional regulator with XRE-family HTH domain